ncbi:hypothetical protein [Streptomyces rhizosphaerihabitans]|uniref:hypothetical protein n=1 Tax=Streptomyces rhizosphaerihabitans TaxID=1266770 RepID=UPI0021C1FF15|nr:hypothetical protein [Streptomyces rhizosphaerihabitans]MCT9007121.1 hypothetical protein [Streptomyces rhizosphaerihabitans]
MLGFKGETKGALAHFSDVYSINLGREVHLGPCRITPQIWSVILDDDPDMKGVPRAVYVIDSLKAFFQARDFHGALEFISSLKFIEHAGIRSLVNEGELIPYPRKGLHYLVNEGMTIAKSRLGWHGDVLESATSLPVGVDMYYQAVMMLYGMESRLALGQETAVLIRKLAILVIGGTFDSIPPTTMLRFIEKYGDLLERLKEDELALGVYMKGVRLARRINDQVSEWTFLRSLMLLGVYSEEQEDWRLSYERLIAGCEYGVVCRVEGKTHSPAWSGSVYERLLEVVKNLTGATEILT